MTCVCTYLCRLDGVESRLQETSAEFEATRALAKKTRSDFEIIKKQRYVCTYAQMLYCYVRTYDKFELLMY